MEEIKEALKELTGQNRVTTIRHKQIAKTGRAFCFYVPVQYIRDDQLSLDKVYTVVVIEEEKKGEESPSGSESIP